jgi:hypothetical protein
LRILAHILCISGHLSNNLKSKTITSSKAYLLPHSNLKIDARVQKESRIPAGRKNVCSRRVCNVSQAQSVMTSNGSFLGESVDFTMY